MCVSNMITFESLDVGSSFLLIRFISREYGSGSYMKIIGLRTRPKEQKGRKSLFSQCKTSVDINSGSINMELWSLPAGWGFLAMADRMVWLPSLLYDWNWPRI